MKLLCILIPFALINILAAAIDEYTNEVICANRYIELAKDFMPKLIKNYVLAPGKKYKMDKLAFMLAVPDSTNEDIELEIKLQYQIDLQLDIWNETGIELPEIDEGDFEGVTLQNLGRARRVITLEAITTLIRSATSDGDRSFSKFTKMCRLIGVFRSIKYPDSFIRNAFINHKGYCEVVADIKAHIYRYLGGQIWEITPENDLIQSLTDQLNQF